MDTKKIIQAGKIASQVKTYAKTIVKNGASLLEIAEKIETKILELGGKPAFPVNLSIDGIAAHYTPAHDDTTLAHGLLKVDIGVHIDGWVADTAFSLDLENSEENQKLIKASEEALKNALNLVKSRIEVNEKNKTEIGLSEIGKTIQETIESYGFTPLANLSRHSIEQYNLHSGINVPNIDSKSSLTLKEGLYAVEPFATNGNGKVHDGKPSNIYHILNEKNPRSQSAREVLVFILKEYKELPFCSRWIVKKFGTRGVFSLHELEANGNLHHFAQLVESSNAGGTKVSQAEQTILVEKNKVTVTTI